MSDDLHTPTTAAPTPEQPTVEAPAVEPSTVDKLREKVPEPVTHAAHTAVAKATAARESLSSAASGANQAPAERPEILAGAAFAGGFLAALVLKKLGR